MMSLDCSLTAGVVGRGDKNYVLAAGRGSEWLTSGQRNPERQERMAGSGGRRQLGSALERCPPVALCEQGSSLSQVLVN